MSAITARGLSKRYSRVGGESVVALEGLSLEVPQGSAFGLIGPNGAGKTTFIKLVLGIARPSSGEVQVLGRSPEDAAMRQEVGYLPERLHLPQAWKPLAWLRSVATLKGLKDAPLPELLRRVGLWDDRERRIGGFSKGMRQRLGLAAALLGSPKLLVLDEPTDGIDPLGRIEVRNLLAQEKAKGATVLLNSHLLSETERVCDRIGVLNQGRLVKAGTLQQLKAEATGYELTFAPGFDLAALLGLGLVPLEGDCFSAPQVGPLALNALIDQARQRGALLTRLEPAAKDLEQLLKDALQ